MTDLNALLTDQIERFASSDDGWEPPDMGMACTFEATLVEREPGASGPTVTAHADVLPGGLVADVRLRAQLGDESRTLDIEPDTGLHQAMQGWFRDLWDTWDEVPEGTPGDVRQVQASELQPGDYLWRHKLSVASVREHGVNSAGQPLVLVTFEQVPGIEVWPADRGFTILRDDTTGEDEDHDG